MLLVGGGCGISRTLGRDPSLVTPKWAHVLKLMFLVTASVLSYSFLLFGNKLNSIVIF